MNDGGRYSIQSPFVSNLPPAWSTLPPPLRNDLAISIISANDSCDDQKFISGSGDFIQYDAGDENDGSEFTPLLHYSALNTRSDTDTATGTGECYIITVNYLHGHDQKFGPYSILVTEN